MQRFCILIAGAFLLTIAVLAFSQPQTQTQTQYQTQPKTQTSPKAGVYRADVSGSIQLHLEGEAFVSRSPRGDWSITMSNQEKPDSPPRTIILVLPGRIKPGSYEIKSYERAFTESGKVDTVAATFSSFEIIGLNATGKLKLIEAGATYSGTYEFSAESYDKQSNVSVKGSFDNLTVQKEKEREKEQEKEKEKEKEK